MAGIIKEGSKKQARIKYGMIGGGPDAFFGAVHRAAAALDGGKTSSTSLTDESRY